MNYSQQVLENVEAYFVDDVVVCPVCDSYDVEEENDGRFDCCECGLGWKTLVFGE